MLPQSDDRFDLELVGWFSMRGGAWSGTGAELLASLRTRSDVDSSLWPRSPRELYAHLEFHRELLQSLGLDVLLHQGIPRLISLRSRQKKQPPIQPPDTFDLDRTSDPPKNLFPLLDGQKTIPADSGNVGSAAGEAFDADIPIATSDLAERFVNGNYANEDNEGRVFKNTGEALVAILEMRRWIREQGLDLESTVDLVIARARQITRSCGIAVGFLPQEIGRQFRTGNATLRKELDFHANLFRPSLLAGETVQLPDAQKHPLLGAICRREGIGSLIMVPIFRDREVAGTMEFLFQRKHSFSAGEVMDLGLIAGVIGDSLGGATHIGVKQKEGREWPPETKTVKNVELQPGSSLKAKAGPGDALPNPVKNTMDAETPLTESDTPDSTVVGALVSELPTVPNQLWLAFKRAWTRHPRGM